MVYGGNTMNSSAIWEVGRLCFGDGGAVFLHCVSTHLDADTIIQRHTAVFNDVFMPIAHIKKCIQGRKY